MPYAILLFCGFQFTKRSVQQQPPKAEWRPLDLTVEVEAKAKEAAVARLRQSRPRKRVPLAARGLNFPHGMQSVYLHPDLEKA